MSVTTIRAVTACLFPTEPSKFLGEISLLRDIFGHTTGAPKRLSVADQIRLLQGPHIHLNLIKVGIDDEFDKEIDAAIAFMRDTYAPVPFGVGRIMRFFVPEPFASIRKVIDNADEADELTGEWTVHNDGIDVFLVRNMVNPAGGGHLLGLSPPGGDGGGPCDKDSNDWTGSVVDVRDSVSLGIVEGSASLLGRTLAHEVGHYLGLDPRFPDSGFHSLDQDNLMSQSIAGRELDLFQRAVMQLHCFTRPGC